MVKTNVWYDKTNILHNNIHYLNNSYNIRLIPVIYKPIILRKIA